MTRIELIERLRRQVYGGFPADEATITNNLVNQWVLDGTAIAAKKNYTDNFQLEGVGFVNNSFYSTFKGLAVTKDENFLYKFTLPEIPIGLGQTEGISRVVFKDSDNNVSFPGVPLSENQVSFARSMRPIPSKVLFYPEGIFCYTITTLPLSQYTATVSMVSGGDATDLNSTLNIPGDYIPVIVEYVKAQLAFSRMQPDNVANDNLDAVRTT